MGQRSFDGMDRGAGAAQCKPLKKAPKKLIEWPSRTTRSIKIDWVICALHPFLEHFSVDWPKERARRQYAQYGEREATLGKSLKNALSIKRALHFPFIQFDFREIQGVTRWQQKKWYSAIKPAPKSSKASIFWPMQLK